MSKQRGFVLVELLVVIIFIALLASLILMSLNQARKKARDTERLSEMDQIILALEFFYDNNGRYPGSADGISNSGEFVGDGGAFENALAPYMTSVPGDPIHDGTTYYYAYDPRHCTDNPMGSCNCAGATGAVLSFNRAETSAYDLRKDTCSGGDMNQNRADYNVVFYPAP